MTRDLIDAMVKLKICGITNWRDAALALDVGADMLGFNFYPPSPRYIRPGAARRIVRRLPKHAIAVGVFVNQTPPAVAVLARQVGLDAVQLHGDETPAHVAELSHRWHVIKAFRVAAGFRAAAVRPYSSAHAILLDGFSRKLRGGTGKVFDWRLARRARRYGRIFLAGGLTPKNIGQALTVAQPYAVDVCSGVESSPGKKDAGKLLQFALLFHARNHP